MRLKKELNRAHLTVHYFLLITVVKQQPNKNNFAPRYKQHVAKVKTLV
jgi:hypothetical protein